MAGSHAALAVALAALLLAAPSVDAVAKHRGFIRMQDGKFVDQECREFNFVGANTWRWMQIAANDYPLSTPGNDLPSTDYLDRNGTTINPVLWAIRELSKSGVTVMRMFGAGVTTDYTLIVKPGTAGADGKTWPNGKWNWDALTGLDKTIGWCRAHGIKVILSFLDNWAPVDSKLGLVYAAGNATGKAIDPDDFYTNELVKDYYKNHVSFILNHVNKQTGLQFKNDPTIMAYNLMNEPRCNCVPQVVGPDGMATEQQDGSNCGNIEKCFTGVQAWVKEMAAFVKSIAPRQMVGVGDEGFATFLNDADGSALIDSNPGDWAPITGDSFTGLQGIRGIDYHSTHMWVDDWQIATPLPPPYEPNSSTGAEPADPAQFSFVKTWLAARSAQAQRDGKPFVVEEFGKYIPRPATSDADIARIRDPWFEEVFGIVEGSVKSGGAINGVVMWKYGVSPYHNNTDKNWINVRDSTWTEIISPLGELLSTTKTAVPNCVPATGIEQEQERGISKQSATGVSGNTKLASNGNYGNHGRRLRGPGEDDVHLWQYISYGHDMAAVDEGDEIAGLDDLTNVRSPKPCARACGLNEDCTAFHYNPDLKRCRLRKNVGSKQWGFDGDGWQTYWQEDYFTE